MKTVLTGGKFNKIHPGHIYLLKFARKHGDRLVVVLAHDSRNNREYAERAKHRKLVLDHVKLVDKVVHGHSKDFMKVVVREKPNVIVLGYDQSLPVSEDKIRKLGIRIVRCKKFKDYRSSS